MDVEHFNKHFIKNKRNFLENFPLDNLKTTFWIENSTQRWTQSRPFLPKSGHFFPFSKRVDEASSLLLVVHVSVTEYEFPEYLWISLKMLEHTVLTMPWLWICMIILHVQQDFEDDSGSKYARILNMAELYMQGLRRVLSMSEFGSIHLNNACICISLNLPENDWICWMSLNMSENALILLNNPGISICCNIVSMTLLWLYPMPLF